MEKKHVLTQDNGSCNNFEKRSVEISNSDLERELRRFFRWRKDVTINRLYKQGSHNYDRFIKHLSEAGYEKTA